MNPADLPIHEIRSDLKAALSAQPRLVLQAPTGSGKSTQVPQMILDDGLAENGRIVVLQPRRIAARMLARRVASERGVRLGSEVGYQVRFENVSGPETRIQYVTEGILLRRMLDDPELPGIDVVVFDEFHERHLFGDITLAQALRLQRNTRPDLKIVVMSATLDAGPLKKFLEPCGHLESEGRTFPVEIAYSAAAAKVAQKPVWEQAAWHFNRLANEQPEGDFLIFMPGSFEINRTIRELESQPAAKAFTILPLYGDLTPEKQDAALDRYEKRKVVVATNVAETSLTIDGVRVVIDSGLARIPVYDPHRGINTILVQKISQASADQRAGRAGRTAEGFCLRLWGEREHEYRAPRELPEIKRLDLSETFLSLKAGGIEDLDEFPWFEAPEPKSAERALTLLTDLGAIEPKTSAITETGRRMVSFPLHPRYSRMFLAAHESACLPIIALMAAFTQGRQILLPINDKRMAAERDNLLRDETAELSDFFFVLRAWDLARSREFDHGFCRKWGIHAQAARQAGALVNQFLSIAEKEGLCIENTPMDANAVRRCLLIGFSDHLARRLDRGTLRCELVHGRRGELRRQSVVSDAPLFVSAEIEERDMRGEVVVLLGMNTAVEEEWLNELFPHDFNEEERIFYDSGQRRVVCRRERRFRDLVLESRESDQASPDQAARLLAEEVANERLKLKGWDGKVEAWINRVNFLSKHCPELEIPEITEDDRGLLLEQICYGAVSYKEIKDRDVWPTLKDWLLDEQLACLDEMAPERYTLPSGRRTKIRYEPDGKAVLSATIQQLYDAPDQPAIAGGRVPLTIELLAPNQRPVQITDNLEAFWENSYPEIKKQLQGRYPKHEWR